MTPPPGWQPPEPGRPLVSVVVLSWNTKGLLRACLSTLAEARHELPLQVVVVDNASHDGSADMVAARFPWVELVRNERNEGYAIGNNIGAARATGRYLLLLNSDTELAPGVLTRLVGFLEEHPGHGACAPRLMSPDGRVQHSCKTFPTRRTALVFDTLVERLFPEHPVLRRYHMRDFDHLGVRDVEQPPGAALLLRRELWERLGGMDPELWLFFNDVDLCRRLVALGYRIAYLGDVAILHHEGASTRQIQRFGAIWHRNRMAYYRKTYGAFGALLARLATTCRGAEEVWRMRRNGAPREARADIWRAVRETWAR